jgi:hypothetical protein
MACCCWASCSCPEGGEHRPHNHLRPLPAMRV